MLSTFNMAQSYLQYISYISHLVFLMPYICHRQWPQRVCLYPIPPLYWSVYHTWQYKTKYNQLISNVLHLLPLSWLRMVSDVRLFQAIICAYNCHLKNVPLSEHNCNRRSRQIMEKEQCLHIKHDKKIIGYSCQRSRPNVP